MYRVLYFFLILISPAIFGWWLFVPLAVLFIYLAKAPYELIIAGAILDSIYYFGQNIFMNNLLTLFSVGLILVALFLDSKIHWRAII